MKENINIDHLQPFGVKITPRETKSFISTDLIQDLIKKHFIVLLRDFDPPNKEALVEYAQTMGPLLEWEFGSVMEMRAQEKPKNYLFTEGSVPFHWDGAFHQVPRYLLFHCIEAPLPHCGGETIFSNTQAIWERANNKEKEAWKNLTLTYKTEKLAHYGGSITVPLVQTHPARDITVLRFAEPVPDTMLNPVELTVNGLNKNDSDQFIRQMTNNCYSEDNCYVHAWKQGDFLIADNHALIHGRRAFEKFSPRHLRRIQVL